MASMPNVEPLRAPPSGKERGSRQWFRLLPMVPGLLFLLAFSVYPLIYALRISFYEWNMLDVAGRTFVGFDNFTSLLSSNDFWHPLGITLTFVAASTTLELVLGMALAMLFYRRFRGDRL